MKVPIQNFLLGYEEGILQLDKRIIIFSLARHTSRSYSHPRILEKLKPKGNVQHGTESMQNTETNSAENKPVSEVRGISS